MENDIQGYWWKRINGAQTFVNGILNALREGKVAILIVPNDLPWRDAMRYVVQDRIGKDQMKRGTEISPLTIDVADSNSNDLDPGKFMLEQLKDDSYRPGSNRTIQEHIVQQGLLQNQLCWIKGLPRNSVESWLKFGEGFTPHNKDKGMLVIELPYDANNSTYRNLGFVNLNNCIREYDVQLLIDYILGQKELNDNWKRYISMLLATVCKKDVEVATELIGQFNLESKDICEALEIMAKGAQFEKRGQTEDHILHMIRHKENDKIQKHIWAAQMQVLYPLIEMERLEWLEHFADQIKQVIENGKYEKSDKTPVTNYKDVEIGLLNHISKKEFKPKPSQAISNRLEMLHQARNNLAHMSCCSISLVAILLNKGYSDIIKQ